MCGVIKKMTSLNRGLQLILLMCFFIYKPINLPLMKTYSFVGVWCCLFIGITWMACNKQEAIPPTTTSTQVVQALKGDSAVNGLINQSIANTLQANFIEKRGNQETRLVKISVKDLINYLHLMQTNAYTDSLGIHMGIYSADNVPPAYPEYKGRYTLYFSVFPASSSAPANSKTLGTTGSNRFLNHGTLYP